MGLSTAAKLDLVGDVLTAYTEAFDVVTMAEHARRARQGSPLARRRPQFETDAAA